MLKNYSNIKVNEYGEKHYLNAEGKLHRLDGPALEYSDGTKYWHVNGISHRNIVPSDEWSDEDKFWFFKDKRHRVGGSSCTKYEWWYIHGEEYSKKEYFNIVWDI